MKRYIVFGAIVFIMLVIAMAPATLVSRLTDRMNGVDILDASGTLWNGQGYLLLQGQDYGQLTWHFQPATLLVITPTFDWQLEHTHFQLNGTLGTSPSQAILTLQGSLTAAAVNPSLSIYDIYVTGDFIFVDSLSQLAHATRTIVDMDGHVNWSGGMVRYTLAGKLHEVQLPPLTAWLQMNEADAAEAVVYPANRQTPLIIASMGENGFVKVGITKLFTKMLHNPWPGSDPDHAVVLEVEEQLL